VVVRKHDVGLRLQITWSLLAFPATLFAEA
jgi:hypothetical protein